MDKLNSDEQVVSILKEIHGLLRQSVDIQQRDTEIDDAIRLLAEKRTKATSGLMDHAALTHTLAAERTDLAKERNALVREQTHLSTQSTELSDSRTQMARERTDLAGQRTDLSVRRTEFSRSRTSLAEQRNQMAGDRTEYSQKRTSLAGTRTVLSNIRTAWAEGRTDLALIRTGLAFLSLSIALFRIFGVSWWSVFDGSLALVSSAMTVVGILGYIRAKRSIRILEPQIHASKEAAA